MNLPADPPSATPPDSSGSMFDYNTPATTEEHVDPERSTVDGRRGNSTPPASSLPMMPMAVIGIIILAVAVYMFWPSAPSNQLHQAPTLAHVAATPEPAPISDLEPTPASTAAAPLILPPGTELVLLSDVELAKARLQAQDERIAALETQLAQLKAMTENEKAATTSAHTRAAHRRLSRSSVSMRALSLRTLPGYALNTIDRSVAYVEHAGQVTVVQAGDYLGDARVLRVDSADEWVITSEGVIR